MWPFRKKLCSNAIPYLKAHVCGPLESNPIILKLSLENSPVLKDFIPGLSISYLADSGSMYTYLQNRHLFEEGFTEDGLHSTALANLSLIPYKIHANSNIFSIIAGGDFEASMVLNKHILKYINKHFKCGVVAAIPARDIFAFAPVGEMPALRELNDVVERVGDTQDHPLVKWLIRYDGSHWSRLDG